MHKIGKSYPNGGYGGYFVQRLIQRYPKPYDRFGNGEATCVSSVVYVAKCIEEVKELSYQVTSVTIITWKVLKGQRKLQLLHMAKTGYSILDIKEYISYTLLFNEFYVRFNVF